MRTHRRSVDILKSGGYKISALEVERRLLEIGELAEIAVFGLDDAEFGQRVAAVVVCPAWASDDEALRALREFGAARLAAYKLPSACRLVGAIPKNAVGKVNKRELRHLFGDGEA